MSMNGQGPIDLSALEAMNRQQEQQMALVPTKAESLRATAVQMAVGLIASGHWAPEKEARNGSLNNATPNDVVVLAERIASYISTGTTRVSTN